MAQLTTVIRYLDSLLQPHTYQDSAVNGLQVESSGSDVRKVALAVDSGETVVQRAVEASADLLVVHHGLFWGQVLPIAGPLGSKIRTLMARRCSLYASHLPLDAHLEVGNNAELARFMGLSKIEPAFEHRGQMVGVIAQCAPTPLQKFVDRSLEMPGARPALVLPFGKQKIERVGIVTGSGSFALEEAAKRELDLFYTGEPKQDNFHTAKDLHLSVIYGGHYATETFGVLALGARLQKDLDLETVFIDEPTGI